MIYFSNLYPRFSITYETHTRWICSPLTGRNVMLTTLSEFDRCEVGAKDSSRSRTDQVVVLGECTCAIMARPPLARPLAPRITELLNLESPLHHLIRFHSWSTRATSALHNARPPCVWKRVALYVQFSVNVPFLSANDTCIYLLFVVCVYVGDFISIPFFSPPSFLISFSLKCKIPRFFFTYVHHHRVPEC